MRQRDQGRTSDLLDLVAGMGSATPVPLFFLDEAGRTHALNALASALREDDPAGEALLSPVECGTTRCGHVVAYVDPSEAGSQAAVVSGLVALTAQIIGRKLGEENAGRPLAPSSAALEIACDRLTRLTEMSAVAQVVADAVVDALGARSTVVLALRDNAVLEPVAARGLDLARVQAVRPGRGLLGWAAARQRATAVSTHFRLPAGAPTDEGRGGPLATWLEPPFVLMPLTGGSQVVGLLCVSGLAATEGQDAATYGADRLVTLVERAGSALAGALVVGQARREERVRREIEIARQIQERLLPRQAPEFPGLDVAGECRSAAQVGGDFYGFRAVGSDAMVMTVFDVAGHGIGAAFSMTLVRSALAGEVAREGSPAEALDRANRLVAEDLAESGLFATAVLARFDRALGRLEVASAGHASPLHWSARDRRFVAHREGGLPLGLFGDSRYTGGGEDFGPGDILVLYTDGIVEAQGRNGECFGRSRLMALVRKLRGRGARALMRAAWRELERFTEGEPLRDDATLLVVRGLQGFGTRERGRAGASVRSVASVALPRRRAASGIRTGAGR